MTIYAAHPQRAVQYGQLAVYVCRLMTGPAGDLLVRAIEHKLRIPIVRKLQVRPSAGFMASLAGNCLLPRFEKLTLVNVLVTTGTNHGERLHPDLLSDSIHFDGVAFQAEDFAVFPVQREARQQVVEGRSMPGLGLMTISASALFDPQIDLSLMHVLVAIGAVLIFQIKAGDRPPILALDGDMALIAGDGEVAAGQRIETLLMGIKGISHRTKACNRMARFTRTVIGTINELI